MTFETYMKQIDSKLASICGLDSSDLADYRYRDAFDDEINPNEVAIEVLIDNGFPIRCEL